MADNNPNPHNPLNEWAVNERLDQTRSQVLKKVEEGLVEDPELGQVDTVGVTLETGGAVKQDEIHLVGTVPSEDMKEHAYEVARRAAGPDFDIVNKLEVEKAQ